MQFLNGISIGRLDGTEANDAPRRRRRRWHLVMLLVKRWCLWVLLLSVSDDDYICIIVPCCVPATAHNSVDTYRTANYEVAGIFDFGHFLVLLLDFLSGVLLRILVHTPSETP